MTFYKVVFEDDGVTKVIRGHIHDLDDVLLAVKTRDGNTVYINKECITFIKEMPRRHY